MVMDSESSRLSLITAGSSMNAAFGGVSATGVGTPEFDVTHSGDGPCAFVATQPAGSVGGVTLSKFSLKLGGHGSGMGRRRRTVAIASPVPAPAIQLTACTNPV